MIGSTLESIEDVMRLALCSVLAPLTLCGEGTAQEENLIHAKSSSASPLLTLPLYGTATQSPCNGSSLTTES
jgi:hypothetical protein